MKLHPTSLAIATAIAFAIIWTVCTVLVAAAPGAADVAFRGMMHMSAAMPAMEITLSGYLIGLVGWVVSAAVTGWLLAAIYNAMSSGKIAS